METITMYKCGKCGKAYTTEEEAKKCEASHTTKGTLIDEIYPTEDKHYSNNYPEAVMWLSPDGHPVRYEFPQPKHKHNSHIINNSKKGYSSGEKRG